MGAGIALNMAIRYPEKVEGLVLVRPAWLDSRKPENLAILIEAAQHIGRENGEQLFRQREDFQAIQSFVPNAAKSVLGVFAETQRPEISKVLECMVNDCPFDSFKELKNIDQPCLIIGNEEGPRSRLKHIEEFSTENMNISAIQINSINENNYVIKFYHFKEVLVDIVASI